jgi:HAD superfamily hydrolase (TIGR01509 family)
MELMAGFIFDFDGVLVDTMAAHFAAYGKALAEFGVPIDRDQFYYQAGMKGVEQIAYFCKHAGREDLDPDEIYRRKGELTLDYDKLVTPIPVNIQLLHALKNAGHPVAIASGSSRPSILPAADRFGIVVDSVVSAEDVLRGKPDPELFLLAAERLDRSPADCVVMEDSPVGLEAALAAGMSCHLYKRTSV